MSPQSQRSPGHDPEEGLLPVRCKACHKVACEVHRETRGRIRVKCKGAKCTNWIDMVFPAELSESSSGYTGATRFTMKTRLALQSQQKAVAVNQQPR